MPTVSMKSLEFAKVCTLCGIKFYDSDWHLRIFHNIVGEKKGDSKEDASS